MLVSVFFGQELMMGQRTPAPGTNVWVYVHGASDSDTVHVQFANIDNVISASSVSSVEIARDNSTMLTPPSSDPNSPETIDGSQSGTRVTRHINFSRMSDSQEQNSIGIERIIWDTPSPSRSLSPERRRVLRRRANFARRSLQLDQTFADFAGEGDPSVPQSSRQPTTSDLSNSANVSPGQDEGIGISQRPLAVDRSQGWNDLNVSRSVSPRNISRRNIRTPNSSNVIVDSQESVRSRGTNAIAMAVIVRHSYDLRPRPTKRPKWYPEPET